MVLFAILLTMMETRRNDEYRRMGDPSFRLHFRITKPMFEELLIVVKYHLIVEGRLQRERRKVSHILLMVLWILATPDTFRSVALRFGVHPGKVHEYYVYVIKAMTELGERFIQWPDAQQRQRTKAALERRSGFPVVIGMIDVTHIPISAPLEDAAAYRDYKQQYSISVQAVCDDRCLVTDLYVGEAGSLPDARVFRRSPLCFNLLQRDYMFSPGEHIIGDGAYMLLDKVIVSFENDGHLTMRQLNFNRRLSQIRSRVEHLYAHAKGLWRRLQYLPHQNLTYGLHHIAASFVLHNYRFADIPRQILGDELDVLDPNNQGVDHLFDSYVPQGDMLNRSQMLRRRGEQKRWDICDDLP
ncbi:Protein ANTAGONIST OF LIKE HETEROCHROMATIN PROTEIN 1 [Frankliniella fusca]|uniref:Protein ANTAGONIST OF LIKE HETEROCHROMATIN PROTEIN 1 n=1 Tax=Frankliniella fusca TaxID=407009 RepID=A0AAE1H3Y0_9NEOP|nr:Protein ANTAGONIST OF LIKE HETEROCHROMATIN PROTEIN 1 [Frankliniella fusca]